MNKKFFYFAAASAIALSACTSEEVVDDAVKAGKAISFENVVNKHSRANGDVNDLTGNGLKQFQVFGFYTTPNNSGIAQSVFNNMTVTRQENGTWTYTEKPHYWIPDAHYYFYAYSCGEVAKLGSEYGSFTLDTSGEMPASNRVLEINNYICDASHQHDLIFASNTGAVEGNEYYGIVGKEDGNLPVPFQFKHILSKVRAQFTSSFHEDYDVTISNVSIENIRNIGSYNPKTGWKNVVRKDDKFYRVFLLNTADNATNPITTYNGGTPALTNSAFVLPYTYSGEDATETTASTWVYLKFDVTVTIKGAPDNVVFFKTLNGRFNPDWKPGYSYTYNVDVNGDASNLKVIAFTVTSDAEGNEVSNWDTFKIVDAENPDGRDPIITPDKN